MGTYIKPGYRRLNKLTGKLEWVAPQTVEFYSEMSGLRKVVINKNKKRK